MPGNQISDVADRQTQWTKTWLGQRCLLFKMTSRLDMMLRTISRKGVWNCTDEPAPVVDYGVVPVSHIVGQALLVPNFEQDRIPHALEKTKEEGIPFQLEPLQE